MAKEINDKPDKPRIIEVVESLLDMVSEEMEKILTKGKEVTIEVKKEPPQGPSNPE